MKRITIIFTLSLVVSLQLNAQTVVETVSSGTSGDATLKIEADTDNNNEADNPRIELKQDGGQTGAYIGFNADWGGVAPDNLFRIGTRYSGVDNFTRFIINPQNGNVGIGTTAPEEKLHVNGTTTITADIGSVTSSHWQTGAHTLELQNSDAGDVVLSFHRAGHTNAAIKHSSLGGLIFSGSGGFDANHLFLKSNGYFGIGTTAPASQLDVRTVDNKGIWINYNNESAITFRPNNGNSVFHLSHGHDNRLHISQGSTVGAGKLMTFVNSGNVGIGTTNPSSKLHVFNDGNRNGLTIENSSTSMTNYGLTVNNTATTNGYLLRLRSSGIDKVTVTGIGNVGIGTTTPDAKLAVNGNIHTKEVKVDLIGWSDFVFEDSYKLPTLKEVEQHIKEKGHLKDIPSAEEVKKEGIYLGEMDSKLLQKIEELMLYTIKQQKEIETQFRKIEKLEKENSELQSLSNRLDEIEQLLSNKTNKTQN